MGRRILPVQYFIRTDIPNEAVRKRIDCDYHEFIYWLGATWVKLNADPGRLAVVLVPTDARGAYENLPVDDQVRCRRCFPELDFGT